MKINFPKHECEMIINHNEHKTYYEKIENYIKEHDLYDWKDEDSKKRCIENNEIWTLQWYPNTPVGFNAVAAPTFEEVVEFANNYED